MEHKDLIAPLSAVIVVLTVLLKSFTGNGNGIRQVYERLANVEAQLTASQHLIEEMRKDIRSWQDNRMDLERICGRHLSNDESRWREFEKWQRWVEAELRKGGL